MVLRVIQSSLDEAKMIDGDSKTQNTAHIQPGFKPYFAIVMFDNALAYQGEFVLKASG
jgi:ABC-type maltose transport system permease subunit